MRKYIGLQRPDFAIEPGPGQESVWDYTRPPALVDCRQLIEIEEQGQIIARSTRCKRVLETASPPTIYIPPEDIEPDVLVRIAGNSYCEWKGAADYWELVQTAKAPAVAWSYPDPRPAFATIRDWLCFYPGRVECTVDGERVRAQDNGFYGAWVTDVIVGPWKGGPGTSHWGP